MTKLAWICALIGWAICGLTALAILWDIYEAQGDRITISRWCLDRGRENPILVVLLTAPVFLAIGILMGHLWFPQYLEK